MAKYYEMYRTLILVATFSGVYFPSIEKIYESKSVKLLKLLSVIPGVLNLMYFVSAMKYQFFDEDILENKIYGFTIVLIVSLISFSFFSYQYYKNDFIRFFELWDSMFQEELYIEEWQVLLRRNVKVTNRWLKICGSFSAFSSIFYCTLLYFKEDKALSHPSGFPYRHQSPDYELVNTLDLVVAAFGFSAMAALDSMTMAYLSMEAAQFKHLKRSLAKIVDIISVSDSGKVLIKSEEIADPQTEREELKNGFEEAEANLRVWISHHHQVIRFHREFQEVFSIQLAAKFTVLVLMICFDCFLILIGKYSAFEIFFSFSFCLANYGIFYASVMYADSILEEAGTIFGDAFEKSWYLYPKALTDVFLIIQMNSQKPVQYLAFKQYSLSSKNFLKILTSAYSLFTFLLQTNKSNASAQVA